MSGYPPHLTVRLLEIALMPKATGITLALEVLAEQEGGYSLSMAQLWLKAIRLEALRQMLERETAFQRSDLRQAESKAERELEELNRDLKFAKEYREDDEDDKEVARIGGDVERKEQELERIRRAIKPDSRGEL